MRNKLPTFSGLRFKIVETSSRSNFRDLTVNECTDLSMLSQLCNDSFHVMPLLVPGSLLAQFYGKFDSKTEFDKKCRQVPELISKFRLKF